MTEAASDWGNAAPLVLLLIVLLADMVFGGLPVLRPVLGLPLNIIRSLTRWFDARLNRENRSLGARRIRGLLVVVVIIALAWIAAVAIQKGARLVDHGWILEAFTVLAFLHLRECFDRMRRSGLRHCDGDIVTAREMVAPLVRYDTAGLDEFAVSRAAIEGGAARFAERLMGTVFWYLLLGLPGLLIYRANGAIADVIGRPSSRHVAFGFVPARLDDVLSLIPALVAGPVLILSALFVPKSSPTAALQVWIQDLADRFLKSGYRGEGAMAGALGVALGGPRLFDGASLPGKWIGAGRARATDSDVDRALFLMAIAGLLFGLALAGGIVSQAG